MKKTPEQIADEIIKIMQDAGLTPSQMLKVLKMVRERLKIKK